MSLRILHTADWHLGQTFFGYDREAEHEAFLSWLIQTLREQETDVLLISGDVFDVANPSATAQRRFFRFLREANQMCPYLQIVIIAGNHDSAARLEAPIPLLEELHTTIVGIIPRTPSYEIDFDSLLVPLYNKEGRREALCLAVPYLRQGDYPASENGKDTYVAGITRMYNQLYEYAQTLRQPHEALVAMGHLHAIGAELTEDDRSERTLLGGLESVGLNAFDEGLAYTALGHIHKAQRVAGREQVRYAGSPLPMSFSEEHYHHQVVAVTLENGCLLDWKSLPIPLQTSLQRIPKKPALPEEVLTALSKLPTAEEQTDRNQWPYVEVQVLLTEPNPGFRHRVEEVLADKAVRLTSIVPSYHQKEGEALQPLSYTDLQKIAPLDMLQYTFTNRYGGDLPEELEQLFNEVLQEISQ
ncbi:MAG: exonuclease SbcCD subunit D C-terminal domain-containing protein [Parabacteroides sp.]|nr:exonuclease SbcCD subunit D C-terminal domain-containing protein [Parabacteroides sp.]